MSNLNAGSTVRLKSGGPIMTIYRLHTPDNGSKKGISLAECQWFIDNKLENADFPVTSLESVEMSKAGHVIRN
jgi:uncharacterized protein YodC (DUF2158 family)